MPVLFFILWVIFNGKITLEVIAFGVPVTAAVTLFVCKILGYPLRYDLIIFKNFPVLILYGLNLIREIVLSASSVIRMIWRAQDPDPIIIEFHSGFTSRLQNVLLANSITLTPGTITVFQEGDHFVIHCLRPEYAEGIENSSFIRLLRKLK